ncbi:hypothetical protein A1704_21655 [Chryseobacterium cucumeris]|uniref:hypothetical protein n=1 Tax=Chryseobacterium cucumeris TaxID=1813611 RepID=UPI00078699D5|nr:hypothetical protein [Chryseobacterium cucumeris]KYH07061.1 hypothetical protein A1704_21655 [Chryseobacterium cucumeris]
MHKISLITLKEIQTLENKNDYIFVNFAYPHSLKIGYFYDEIKKSERHKLIKLFNQLTGVEIRVDDTLGKLHIILLQLLLNGKQDNIVISTIGFHIISFEFLINNFTKIFNNLNGLANKNIIIVECNINNQEDIEYLEKYFSE